MNVGEFYRLKRLPAGVALTDPQGNVVAPVGPQKPKRRRDPLPCVHRGEPAEKLAVPGCSSPPRLYPCTLFGSCILASHCGDIDRVAKQENVSFCERCQARQPAPAAGAGAVQLQSPSPPLVTTISPLKSSPPQAVRRVGDVGPATGLVDRCGNRISLDGLWGGSVFMVLGGPSLAQIDPESLSQRGIATLGVNNAAAIVRPTLWTYGDSSWKFHSSIFRDPGILKFVPRGKLTERVREKHDGRFRFTTQQISQMPGIVGLEHHTNFRPDEWLWEPSFCWGNGEESARLNGWPHVLSTMLQALKLAFYLGFRRVYLLGCDFHMEAARPYGFSQGKHPGGVEHSNRSYQALAFLLSILAPRFREAEFEVLNCNPTSGLDVFPKVDYRDALAEALRGIEQEPETDGWYDENRKEERPKPAIA